MKKKLYDNYFFTITIMIYVLLLENSKWYVGYTNRINGDRFLEHFDEKGSEWTRLHKPIQVMLFREGTLDDERRITLEYMEKYGWYNVRGGPWCRVLMIEPPEELKPKNLPKPLNKTKSYIKYNKTKSYAKKEYVNKYNNIKEEESIKCEQINNANKEENNKTTIVDSLIELIKIWKNTPDENLPKDDIINDDITNDDNLPKDNIINDENLPRDNIIINDSVNSTEKITVLSKNTATGTKWTDEEVNQLIKELREKKSIKEISSLHLRSKNAIELKLKNIITKRNEKESIINISDDLCLAEKYVKKLLMQPIFCKKYNYSKQ